MFEHLSDVDDGTVSAEATSSSMYMAKSFSDVSSATFTPAVDALPEQIDLAKQATDGILRSLACPNDLFVEPPEPMIGPKPAPVQDLTTTPLAVANAFALLDAYDHDFVHAAGRIRTMLVTKLLEMVDQGKPSDRLRAIEMLGKVAEVSLFAEKTVVHHERISETDLNRQIAEKLRRFSGVLDVEATQVAEKT
jgi:hypothetical protein